MPNLHTACDCVLIEQNIPNGTLLSVPPQWGGVKARKHPSVCIAEVYKTNASQIFAQNAHRGTFQLYKRLVSVGTGTCTCTGLASTVSTGPLLGSHSKDYRYQYYSGRGKFMPLPLKSKILETPGTLVTDGIKMFPLWIPTLNLQASLMVQYELSRICNFSATCPQSEQT